MTYKILETGHLITLPEGAENVEVIEVADQFRRWQSLDAATVDSLHIPGGADPNIYVYLAQDFAYTGGSAGVLTLQPVEEKEYLVKIEVKVRMKVAADELDVEGAIHNLNYEFTTDDIGVEIVDTEIEEFDWRETNEDGSVKEPWIDLNSF